MLMWSRSALAVISRKPKTERDSPTEVDSFGLRYCNTFHFQK